MKALRFAGLALVLAAPLAAAVAPAVDPKLPGSFGESIDVRVVNVEAVVTDRRGHRVQGLSTADFRLLVDGKEVPVDYFTEVVEGEMATPPVEPSGPAPATPLAPGGKVGTSYLVFIDDSFSIAAQRDFVLQRLARDLGRLGPEDRVAVVAFDGRKIDRLTDWTGDRASLQATLEAAQRRPSRGIDRLAMRRTEGVAGDLIIDEGGASFMLYPEVESAAAAAGAAMRGIAAPSGRKILLLLSGGWPLFSAEHLILDPLRKLPSSYYVPRVEELFEPVTDTANLLGYTIYPVDVPGLDPESTWADASAMGPSEHTFITSEWERGSHAVLEILAGQTGGKAVLNSARLNAFERAAADTRTYYWLGFTPEWRADGKRHDVRVEVRRPGITVRARKDFTDLSRETSAKLRLESLLLFGGDAQPDLRVLTGTPRRSGLWQVELPVTLEIPASALTALPAGDGYEVQATLSMGALDPWGGRSRIEGIPIHLTLPAPPAPGTFTRYETTVKLHKGPQRLVFAVDDAAGGGQTWAELEVKP